MLTQLSQADIWEQAATCGYALLLGVVLCLIYDSFRIHRILKHPKRLVVFGEDILFFAGAAVLVFCFLVIRCDGELRLYVLACSLLGSILFRCSLNKKIFKFRLFAAKKIQKVLTKFKGIGNKLLAWIFARVVRCKKKLKNILKTKKKALENGTSVDV